MNGPLPCVTVIITVQGKTHVFQTIMSLKNRCGFYWFMLTLNHYLYQPAGSRDIFPKQTVPSREHVIVPCKAYEWNKM